jgi:protein-disulfide isomerase
MATAPLAALVAAALVFKTGLFGLSPPFERLPVPNWRAHAAALEASTVKGGAVSIVVWGDYRCAACVVEWPKLVALANDLGNVRLEWRRFPIMGRASLLAANAVECADTQGHREAMHRRVINDGLPTSPTPACWSNMAIEVGVRDSTGFRECVTKGGLHPAVRLDVDEARALGVRATPTLLIDSLLIVGSPGIKAVTQLVTVGSR